MTDVSKLGFVVKGPYRHSDGSFKFTVVVLAQSEIVGQVPTIKATADVHVDNDKVCGALGQALISIAQQLPPELMGLG